MWVELCACVKTDRVHSVPQSEETRAELSQIAWVPRQVKRKRRN